MKDKTFIQKINNKHGKKQLVNVGGVTKFVITENKAHKIPDYKKTKQ